MDKLKEALKRLDVKNDNHWTAEGLPKLETVKLMASNQKITRDEITKLAPDFNRTTQVFPDEPVDATGATTGTTPTPGDLKTSIGPQMSEVDANAAAVENQTLGSKEPNPDAMPKEPLTEADKAKLASEATVKAVHEEGAQLVPVLGTGANRDPVKNLEVKDESELGVKDMALKVPNPVPHDANSNPTNPDTTLARMEMPNAEGFFPSDVRRPSPQNQEAADQDEALAEADALQGDIDDARDALEAARQKRDDFDKQVRAKELAYDELVTKQTKLRHRTQDETFTRMAYLEAQKRIREQQAGVAGTLKPPKAPIDRAMERKSKSPALQRPRTL